MAACNGIFSILKVSFTLLSRCIQSIESECKNEYETIVVQMGKYQRKEYHHKNTIF